MKSIVRSSAFAFSALLGASGAVLGASGVAAAQTPECSAGTCTVTFDAAGTADFEVPDGVTVINVTAVGARGGQGGGPFLDDVGGAPGRGALVNGIIGVTPGEVLTVTVGGVGADGLIREGGSGIGSGGHGGASRGGGGGGASGVVQSGLRVVVAGGGGGGGGSTGPASGGAGGDAGQDGAASGAGAQGGGGAVGTVPGTGGTGNAGNGSAGSAIGDGGAGANTLGVGGGGGGGGGLVGGGGGGTGADTSGGAGGGGGSSTGPAVPVDEPARVMLTYVDPDFVPEPPDTPGFDFGSIEELFS